MRISEILKENATSGATSSGSVATVAMPLGSILSRAGSTKTAKYSNSARSIDSRKKKHAGR